MAAQAHIAKKRYVRPERIDGAIVQKWLKLIEPPNKLADPISQEPPDGTLILERPATSGASLTRCLKVANVSA
jgi:hypothetical protein